MPDVILDAAVTAVVAHAYNPEIRDWLVRRRMTGHVQPVSMSSHSAPHKPVPDLWIVGMGNHGGDCSIKDDIRH
jgi:hypothetical protein